MDPHQHPTNLHLASDYSDLHKLGTSAADKLYYSYIEQARDQERQL